MVRDYLMILSSGRSGSNWLLDIFNLSDVTFPRNEPDAEEASAFWQLRPSKCIVGANESLLDERWDDVVDEAAHCVGPRDRVHAGRKRYFRPVLPHLGPLCLLRRNRTRRMLSKFITGLRGSEWRVPLWMIDEKQLDESLPIFKINNAPGLGIWALRHRPQMRLLHLVRHPGGMLNSWTKRYLSQADSEYVLQHNRDRLKRIIQLAPQWQPRFGDIDAMDLKEAELWYWRYANETLYVEGQQHDQCHTIAYEQLTREPLACARQAFDFVGLAWSPRIEQSVVAMSKDSPQIAKAWHSRLTAEQIDMVHRVLDGSPLQQLWNDPHGAASAA